MPGAGARHFLFTALRQRAPLGARAVGPQLRIRYRRDDDRNGA
ncbi:hypothetical protein X011_02785 [Mycobacterium tuberculosis variant microti OV254]|nr:hypothetical protein X011_02785 [Mycobacterium tuberculosis variant microti OV254]